MKGVNGTKRHGQHDIMLLLACVLTLAGFLFTVDFSSFDDDALRVAATRQAENAPVAPQHQQSAPASRPMRAILAEAGVMKFKVAWPNGLDAALPAASTDFAPFVSKSAEGARVFAGLSPATSHFGSARAPPKSA